MVLCEITHIFYHGTVGYSPRTLMDLEKQQSFGPIFNLDDCLNALESIDNINYIDENGIVTEILDSVHRVEVKKKKSK